MGMMEAFGVIEMFRNQWLWLHNSVNSLRITELYTKRLIS